MVRDRQQTEQRLIDAVHELITKEGFDRVRINRLSQRANVNKILIYRYFGGLDGLLKAYHDKYVSVTTTPMVDQQFLDTASASDFLQFCSDKLLDEFRTLRSNVQAQQLLKKDLFANQSGNPATFISGKEAQVEPMLDALSRLVHAEHGRPLVAVMVSAMTLLTFLAEDKRTLFGISLGTDEGWQQIEGAVEYIYDTLARVTPANADGCHQPSAQPDKQQSA